MSVEVLSPSLPGPSGLGSGPSVNGTNGFTNGDHHDTPMEDGNATAGSKFPAGMILPPPDMRTIIESTAGFVATSANAVQFETKIRENHRQDPKFSFLNSADPYHAYYRYRIERVQSGDTVNESKEKEAAAKASSSVPVLTDIAPKEPPQLEFVLPIPHKSAVDIDILKLTALFAARRGPSFLRSLTMREGRNYQFDFLRPDHSLFSYFNSMVEQYSKVLYPPKPILEKLEALTTSNGKTQLLSEARERGAWDAYQRERESKREKERDAEAIAFAEIDWHDFAIVQTIEFTQADAQSELPLPMTVADVESMTLSQKRMAAMITENMEPEVEAAKAGLEAAEAAERAAQHALNEAAVSAANATRMDVEDAEDARARAEEKKKQEEMLARARELQAKSTEMGEPIKIRKDYVPKTLAARAAAKATTTQCSICGQQIPVDELEEHMRIELLDPKWKSQRDALEARRAQSHELQRGANAASALKQLAKARIDLFDGDEEKRKREEEEEQVRRKEREKGVWDGHTASKVSTQDKYASNVNFDEQIAAIHKAKGLGLVDNSTIGPSIGPSFTAPPPSLPAMPAPTPTPAAPPLPINPTFAAATISSGPQPASAFPPMGYGVAMGYSPAGAPVPGSAAPPGIHPSRLAVLGGQPGGSGLSGGVSLGVTRSADDAQLDGGQPGMGMDGIMAKKPRIERPEGHYYPEEDWLTMHPAPVTVSIQLPSMPENPEYKFDGSVISLAELPLTLYVSSLRDRINQYLEGSCPAGKMKFTFRGKTLTNQSTLASHNMDDDDLIVLSVKKK